MGSRRSTVHTMHWIRDRNIPQHASPTYLTPGLDCLLPQTAFGPRLPSAPYCLLHTTLGWCVWNRCFAFRNHGFGYREECRCVGWYVRYRRTRWSSFPWRYACPLARRSLRTTPVTSHKSCVPMSQNRTHRSDQQRKQPGACRQCPPRAILHFTSHTHRPLPCSHHRSPPGKTGHTDSVHCPPWVGRIPITRVMGICPTQGGGICPTQGGGICQEFCTLLVPTKFDPQLSIDQFCLLLSSCA